MSDRSSREHFVIGTAGHIDHGKSTLVKALTGTDPDRLAEEKARGMTIELGFAWMETPGARSVSIVDVPGHERFIKNMLAGVGGIDAALLVIAADDGPMPQTVEHLAILNLLQVQSGVIALSKSDLVDADWLDMIEESIRDETKGSFLADAPIVRVSAVTRSGIEELLAALDETLSRTARPVMQSKPRLPVDRVFSLQGFGTIVTGTLIGGALEIGAEARIMPKGLSTRIRGLQTHSTKVERALPGSRVAVNVTGLAVDDLKRGDVLTLPGVLQPTQRIDVRLQLLESSPVALEQNMGVDFFTGAAEVPARVTLLDQERLHPGESGWVQLRFREPIAVLKSDRFIIRRPSPSLTIGGGEVVDPAPVRHRRFRSEVVNSLEVLALGTPDELLYQLLGDGPLDAKSLRLKFPESLSAADFERTVEQLIAEGDLFNLSSPSDLPLKPTDILINEPSISALLSRVTEVVSSFHGSFPLRKGIPREELKSRLQLKGPARIFEDVIRTAAVRDLIVDDGLTIQLPGFSITFTAQDKKMAEEFLAALRSNEFSPPSPAELVVSEEILRALVDLGEIVKITETLFYDAGAFLKIEAGVLGILKNERSITIASFRDHFGTSRKYAQAVLEHFDQRRITRRVGDERVRFTGVGAGQVTGGLE